MAILKRHNTFFKKICFTLFFERVETSVNLRERERERVSDRETKDRRRTQAEDCYIDPYLYHVMLPCSGPHLALPLPLGWGVRPLDTRRPLASALRTSRLLDGVSETGRIWRGYPCIYNFITPTLFFRFVFLAVNPRICFRHFTQVHPVYRACLWLTAWLKVNMQQKVNLKTMIELKMYYPQQKSLKTNDSQKT